MTVGILRGLLLVLSVSSLAARAEEQPEKEAAVEVKLEEWEEHRHFMTGFGGVTISSSEGMQGPVASAATFGFDYSYRLSNLFGVGVFFDAALGPLNEVLVGPCLFFFPWQGLFLELSPSLEIEENEALFLAARLAVGYEFELTPQLLLGVYVAADYGHSRLAAVPGVTLGYGF